MPTANDYRAIAASLQQLQSDVASWWTSHTGEMDDVVFDAPDRANADTSRQSGEATLQSIFTEIETQIVNANYRAAVCEQYTSAVNSYLDSTDPDKIAPTLPASWVTAG